MPRFTSSNKEPIGKLLVSVKTILNQNNLLTLSTYDPKNKQPCVCSAYYCYDDDFNLYIWTDPKSQHGQNIHKNPTAAVNIADTTQPWGSLLQGLQIKGQARPVTLKELIFVGKLYLQRFPRVSRWVKQILDFHSKKYNSRLYTIQPQQIKIFDEKTFGKEEYRKIQVH